MYKYINASCYQAILDTQLICALDILASYCTSPIISTLKDACIAILQKMLKIEKTLSKSI